ncbi:alpha/beta fold hydrolase [Phenylobacterium aquaticum]|uniref:alpha/beta fold hydrolase n=1 Tax=Phenylobacterium aquaticum TaxID=1763816 RepID=UPI001F5DF58C|nr:alpha/beta hydrolase [Phenylobacterium aquaticum]MCI3133869.1 alpha/beta hydrolase [Phenylobacterium aquaticum]
MDDPIPAPGDRTGQPPLVVYFHGAPGSPREIGLIVGAAKARGLSPVCLHRAILAKGLTGAAHFDAVAADLRARAAGRQIDMIGFSIGAFVALEVAARLGDQVRGLDLVSPAGPIDGPDDLKGVAGAALFRMARRAPLAFRLATALQGLIARIRPDALFDMLFATAAGDDKPLAQDSRFKTLMKPVLKDALGAGRAGYVRDLQAYVRPWADDLARLSAPVRIWSGSLDTWAPPAMAERLRDRLPAGAGIETLAGRSHYSSLIAAAPKIFERLAHPSASDPARGGD